MKIAWIADFVVKTYKSGGAQYTNDMLIREARKRGHEVKLITPNTDVYIGTDTLCIINNQRYFTKAFIQNIIDSYPFMKFEHDYWICSGHRGYPGLIEKSLLNITMSRKHLEEVERRMQKKLPKPFCCTSPVDTDVFFIDSNIEKQENLVVWTGHDVPDNKGIDYLLDYTVQHPELEFRLFGKFEMYTDKNTPDNVFIEGEVEQAHFRDWLQKARYLMACPRWIEPSGRSVIEGLLCGCTLIVNKNIGFLYEDIDMNDLEDIRKRAHSEGKFWDKIEEVMK